jgi:hypothetical protein
VLLIICVCGSWRRLGGLCHGQLLFFVFAVVGRWFCCCSETAGWALGGRVRPARGLLAFFKRAYLNYKYV